MSVGVIKMKYRFFSSIDLKKISNSDPSTQKKQSMSSSSQVILLILLSSDHFRVFLKGLFFFPIDLQLCRFLFAIYILFMPVKIVYTSWNVGGLYV